MSSDLLHGLFSDVWSIFLTVLFFGGSIFVHELGHFLAARRRGVHIERFSIGFGPKILGWRGKDGIEYRLSLLPLGGYVALPQLADLRGIEGDSDVDVEKLPPLSYATKMIVFAAGAAFNVLFALILATVIWLVGQPISSEMASTRVGYVSPTLELPDGSKVRSPASEAGLKVGDVIRRIDGTAVGDWSDIMQALVTGSGRSSTGMPMAMFTLERDGHTEEVALYPLLTGEENFRRVGISPAYELIVQAVAKDSLAAQVGFQANDEILAMNGKAVLNVVTYHEILTSTLKEPVQVTVRRAGAEVPLVIPARPDAKPDASIGLGLMTGIKEIHPAPFKQLVDCVINSYRNLASLINPHSDIGLDKMSGPVGIARIFHTAAEVGILPVLTFTIFLNMGLAFFNLLPIPVLDGGQMLFATIAKLRGRALPVNFVMATQSVFMVLLFSMIIYVSFFDVRRWARDAQADKAEAAAAEAGGK